jgi:glutamate/tyrosine decarboxylase-like PLP-dependent enzyme
LPPLPDAITLAQIPVTHAAAIPPAISGVPVPRPDAPETPATPYPADTLGMPEEQMRRLGYQVVDLVVDRLLNRHREPAILTGDAAALRAALGGAVPEQALDPEQSLALLAGTALAHQQHGDHPRYFARVPGPSSFAAVLGDWLGTGFNSICASWAGGSGPATLELVVIDWLRQLLGLPEGTEGVLLSGGSLASQTAFSAARAVHGSGMVYMSDQTHASLPRALLQLGFPRDALRTLPSDDHFRLPLPRLRECIAADRAAGHRPLMVIANAGTTNTGSVDPLPALAQLCAEEQLWLHVDAAYGGPAAFTPRGKTALAGLERADSLVLDPHKWLFQPYDLGCLLIRGGALERCFHMNPEYLRDVASTRGEVDFRNRSPELTRRARAAKLWFSLRSYGMARIRAAIERGIALAEFAEAQLRSQPEVWAVVSPAQLGIVCFAPRDAAPGEAQRRAAALSASGFACVSSTQLQGREALRLCTINPLTTEQDIATTLDLLAS